MDMYINNKYSDIFYNRDSVQQKKIWNSKTATEIIDKKISFSGKCVLDFGCLICSRWLDKAKKEKGNYFGYDIDSKTKTWLSENKLWFDFWNMENRFDVILATHVYEHLEPSLREKFVKRCRILLKSGGILVLNYPRIENFDGLKYWSDITHSRPPAATDDILLLRLSGFKKVDAYLCKLPRLNIFKTFLTLLLGLLPQTQVIIFAEK